MTLATRKPISTISYNTLFVLTSTLENFRRSHVLQFWAVILHKAEEGEKKDHYHVYIEPAKSIEPDVLRDEFKELDPEKPNGKPLGVQPFRPSDFANWYLYTLHNQQYLQSKGQFKRFHYNDSDFITSDDDYFHEMINTIDWSKIDGLTVLKDAIEHDVSFEQLVAMGVVPVQQVTQWRTAYSMLVDYCTDMRLKKKGTPSEDVPSERVNAAAATTNSENSEHVYFNSDLVVESTGEIL